MLSFARPACSNARPRAPRRIVSLYSDRVGSLISKGRVDDIDAHARYRLAVCRRCNAEFEPGFLKLARPSVVEKECEAAIVRHEAVRQSVASSLQPRLTFLCLCVLRYRLSVKVPSPLFRNSALAVGG